MKKHEHTPATHALSAERTLDIRFSEVDSMQVAWHGSYALYFEDAREAFGKKYGLDYLTIYRHGYLTPLVDLSFRYLHPIVYGMRPVIRITYVPVEAAKLVFEYEIFNPESGETLATGRSVQVFLDKERQLMWSNPDFYELWKEQWTKQ